MFRIYPGGVMTQTERTRFTILIILLAILIVFGILIDRFRSRGGVGADILGTIQNQAVAIFKDADGLEQTSLSDISQLTVSGGVSNLTVNYELEKRPSQAADLDIQFYQPSNDEPVTTVKNKKGEGGSVIAKLKNVPNGVYDITVKPIGFLSRVKGNFPYANGQPTTLEFKGNEESFLWGDIDVSHNDKGDNTINNADWSILVSSWNAEDERADINEDGVVNNVDASVLLKNWGERGRRFRVEFATDAAGAGPEI